MSDLLLCHLQKHFHPWHEVWHLCKRAACYQASNHLQRARRVTAGTPLSFDDEHLHTGRVVVLPDVLENGVKPLEGGTRKASSSQLQSWVEMISSKCALQSPCCKGYPAWLTHPPTFSWFAGGLMLGSDILYQLFASEDWTDKAARVKEKPQLV